MSYKRKYQKGSLYLSAWEAIADVLVYNKAIYWNHKVFSPGWALNWTVKCFIQAVEKGVLWKAEKVE